MVKGTNEADAQRPSVEEYAEWHKSHTGDQALNSISRYEAVGAKIRSDIEASPFWRRLVHELRDIGDRYEIESKHRLFATPEMPDVYVKSASSIVDKIYRLNVLYNKRWPNPPNGAWVTSKNWYERLNDVVRTTLVVKYLDGVEFLVEAIGDMARRHELPFHSDFQARDEGYYAAHCYATFDFDIPQPDWDTKKSRVRFELQITTQLQDVIRKLTHEHYERRRSKLMPRNAKWQWDYTSPEFVPNYLGHMLHYLEGMIMKVRDGEEHS